MADLKDTNEAIERLKRENAELSGLVLATGVILTQLQQSICLRELNPQAAAGKIMTNAREAIEGFTTMSSTDPVMKARALEAVNQYEEQVRSVLRT
jgi:N-acetylglutamate synthase/N-acetylornithine aminotransferase